MSLSRLLLSYPLHRAVVAGLSFGAAIVGARLLPAGAFAELMTAAFLAKFLQILNLGATAGYFVSRYSSGGQLQRSGPGDEGRFLLSYLAQMVGLATIAIVLAAIWLAEYRSGAVAFLLLVPLFVLEPALRYRRNFSFSLAPEFLLSLALLATLAAHLAGVSDSRLMPVYLTAIAALCMVVIAHPLRRHASEWREGASAFGLRAYARVMIGGSPVYLGTALFLVASSIDRLLLPLYGSDEQISIYFLAYQLSVGSMIFVTAINFVNTVALGEARLNKAAVDRGLVARQLRTAALVACASYGVLVAGALILESGFLPGNFDGLSWVVILLGAGIACFFTSNAITPIVAYYRRQIPLTISMGAVTIALAANNAWVYWSGHGTLWLAAGTALALTAHAGFATWFTFSVLRRQQEEEVVDAC